MSNHKTAQIKVDSILGVVLFVAFIVGMFFVLKGLFWVLSWVAPVMLIATLIIDRSVVINYGKWLLNLFKKNPLAGVIGIALSLLGYMVVCPFLLAKALFKKKVKTMSQAFEQHQQAERQKQEGELVDFEELESKPKKEPETLQLPRLTQQKQERPRSEYDKMFE